MLYFVFNLFVGYYVCIICCYGCFMNFDNCIKFCYFVCFFEVVCQCSFVKVVDVVVVLQLVIFKIFKELEEIFGVCLFEWSKVGVELIEVGVIFLCYVGFCVQVLCDGVNILCGYEVQVEMVWVGVLLMVESLVVFEVIWCLYWCYGVLVVSVVIGFSVYLLV